MKLTELRREPVATNFFAPRAYIQSQASTGMLSTRFGKRLIAIPDVLMQSIHHTLLSEAGQAASLAFYTFGFGWGKSFYDRVRKEMEVYFETSISQMNAAEYFCTLQEIWGVHGLGKISVNFSLAKSGILLVTIDNSGVYLPEDNSEFKSFSVEAGLIGGWFSAQTHQNLSACATNWNKTTRRTQYFVGASPHIEQIEVNYLIKGMRTAEIIEAGINF